MPYHSPQMNLNKTHEYDWEQEKTLVLSSHCHFLVNILNIFVHDILSKLTCTNSTQYKVYNCNLNQLRMYGMHKSIYYLSN